jgi:hypothetical protein
VNSEVDGRMIVKCKSGKCGKKQFRDERKISCHVCDIWCCGRDMNWLPPQYKYNPKNKNARAVWRAVPG